LKVNLNKGQKSRPLGLDMASPVVGILLAAGESRRLGRPKAMVELGGRPLIWWAHHHLERAGLSSIVVVHPTLEEAVRALLPSASVVVNVQPQQGRTGSLQCGLQEAEKALNSDRFRVLLAPVDRPGWNPKVVERLLNVTGSVCPSSRGVRGHPVLLDEDAVDRVRDAHPDQPLREIVTFASIEMEAPHLSMNIDTEDDVTALGVHEEALLSYFGHSEVI
jgi:molybdenum cofactor cytidylyltransferase